MDPWNQELFLTDATKVQVPFFFFFFNVLCEKLYIHLQKIFSRRF